jgi:plastocyanin
MSAMTNMSMRMKISHYVWFKQTLVTIVAIALFGCSGDIVEPYTPAVDKNATSMFWGLELNYETVLLSTAPTYDTFQIVATPRDGNGNAIVGLGPVTFTNSNADVAEVTPEGKVIAKKAGTTDIRVSLTHGEITQWTDMRVQVSEDPNPPVITEFSIAPQGGDSTIWAVNGNGADLVIAGNGMITTTDWKIIFGVANDQNGFPISGVTAPIKSLNPNVAQWVIGIETIWALKALTPGHATLYTKMRVYNKPIVDTVEFTITMPVYSVVAIRSRPAQIGQPNKIIFESSDITISPGGTVVWANVSGEPVDIVFDDPSNVVEHGSVSCGFGDVGGVGNIDAFGEAQDPEAPQISPANCRSRRFPVAGVYTYRSVRTGAQGRVVVDRGI